MKKARLLYLLIAFSLATLQAYSQILPGSGSARGAGLLSGQLPANTRLNLEVGTGFSSFSNGAGMFGSYVSPVLQFDVSPSFSVVTGGRFSFNQYSNLPQPLVVHSNVAPVRQGPTDYSIFMSGRYLINENLIMTGTVFKDQGYLPMLFMDRGGMDYSSSGMSMGLEYRISNNLSFGAEVGMTRTNNPYHFYSPFSDPFGSRQGRSRYGFSPY